MLLCLQDALGDTWEILLMSVNKNIHFGHQTHVVNKLRCPSTNEWIKIIQWNIIQPQKETKH